MRPIPASAARLARRSPSSASVAAPTTAARRARSGAGAKARAAAFTSGTANWRAPPSSRPGTYSSSTAWKLVPPKPKALTPPRRTPDSGRTQSRSSVLTRKGLLAKSMSGLGREKLRLGGSTLSWIAMTILKMPAAPAPALR